MGIEEIKLGDLDPEEFIEEKAKEISSIVGDSVAINALSGGVDSSVVTMLGHKALKYRQLTYFIDTGLMREGEPEEIASLFTNLGVNIMVKDAKDEFFTRLKGVSEPEEKRDAITQAFYRDTFGPLVRESGAKYLLQGTNYTDVEETVAGVKRQHNILAQLGIDTEKEYGFNVLEPLIQLRKPGVRTVAEALGLPEEIYNRMPFPGPALAARVIGEVTPGRVKTVRKATKIVEEELYHIEAFQYLAVLYEDKVTGVRDGKREYGQHIEVRCWDSEDAVRGSPTEIPYRTLKRLADRITTEVPEVVSVSYNITDKPPSTIEAI